MKRRRNILKQVKGFRHGRKSKERMAREALLHAGFTLPRPEKEKEEYEGLVWQVKINAASRANGISYSKLINNFKRRMSKWTGKLWPSSPNTSRLFSLK